MRSEIMTARGGGERKAGQIHKKGLTGAGVPTRGLHKSLGVSIRFVFLLGGKSLAESSLPRITQPLTGGEPA